MNKSENQNNIMRNYNLNIYDIKNKFKVKDELDSEETTTQTQTNNNQKNAKVKNEEKEKKVEIDEKDKGKIEIENTNIKEIKIKEEDNKKNIYTKNNVKNNNRKNIEIFFPEKVNNNYSSGTNKNYIQNQINLNRINNNYFYLQSQLIHLQQSLNEINRQKNEFEKMKILGECAISNPKNINNYLYNRIPNNFTNNNFSQNSPLNPFVNRVNFNFNYYGFQNPLTTNYLQNQSIMNMNYLSNMNNFGNSNKYTITFKSKTNIPNVEKVSKIKVVTSYRNKKDNSKIKLENNANSQSKKEKSIKNKINIDDIISGKETRTVIRLNPIPPSYSSFDISKLLDKYLKIESLKNNRIYKAIYVPLCKVIGKNLGYCFVMMVQPKYVIDFYKVFFGKVLGEKKCNKPCNVIWADFQGDKFLKQNEDDPLRKPLIFKDTIKDSNE